MTIGLREMTSDEIVDFLALTRAERTRDLVRIGLGTEETVTAATDEAIAQLFPAGAAGDNLLFTVVEDDRPAGYLWLREDQPASFSVWWVYVRPSERRRGIGRAAMLLAEEEAKSCGGVELRFERLRAQPDRAGAL